MGENQKKVSETKEEEQYQDLICNKVGNCRYDLSLFFLQQGRID